MNTAVAFFIFNRPDLVSRVFAAIRSAKPKQLYLIADAAKSSNEQAACTNAQDIVRQGIDWDCQLITNIARQNMGCARRISSGLDWVFSHTEEAILLEDDCLPSPGFFPFCEEMLARYRSEPRIMHIAGYNPVPRFVIPTSYTFSRYGSIWAWASWRRAWTHYDFQLRRWPEYRDNDEFWKRAACSGTEVQTRIQTLDALCDNPHTWDMQWSFARLKDNGLSVVPAASLVENIGFDDRATHTKYLARLKPKAHDTLGRLEHPKDTNRNVKYDEVYSKMIFPPPGIYAYVSRNLLRVAAHCGL